MPMAVVKGSLDYCLKNKLFFILVIIIFAIVEYSTDILDIPLLTYLMSQALLMGYGLQIIDDVINGGTRLPKIMPKKVILLGLKGLVISFFYFAIGSLILVCIAIQLKFPLFSIESFFLEYRSTITMLFNHDWVSSIIFVFSGFIVTYVVSFFMELSLAKLADGGRLRNSFNFSRIKRAIDVIGWKNYTIGYTKIIFVIVIFSHINKFLDPYYGFNVVLGTINSFITFIVEYRGMGIVYKVYTDNKKNIN